MKKFSNRIENAAKIYFKFTFKIKTMFKSFAFIIAIVALSLAFNLCFTYKTEVHNSSKKLLKKEPETNYKEFCAGCHGEKMNAFVDRKWKHGSSHEDLFKAIKTGYADEGMPGFDTAFSDVEMHELADYILTGIKNVNRYDFTDKLTSNIFKTESLTIRLDTLVTGLNSPWGMAFLPGGDMLVTDRSGSMYRVKDKVKSIVEGVPEVVAEGQGGLLDVILHPQFKKNKIIYISYSLGKKTDKGILATTAIAKATLNGNKLTGIKNIFIAEPYSRTKHHYGSRMQFGKDGCLYFSVGERGNEKENPQSLTNDLGKIHRIKDDGSIPKDNPFVNTPGAKASIWSYGHRNPQGAAINPATGVLWTNEHGPRGGDEINIIGKGKNYGWPLVCYGINYNGVPMSKYTTMEGIEPPILYWIPSIAPSGMAFVKGDRYKGWKGNLLVGSLRFKYLNLCRLKGNKVISEEILFKNIGRVRDVRMAPDGFIYMSVENPGIVYKLVPVK